MTTTFFNNMAINEHESNGVLYNNEHKKFSEYEYLTTKTSHSHNNDFKNTIFEYCFKKILNSRCFKRTKNLNYLKIVFLEFLKTYNYNEITITEISDLFKGITKISKTTKNNIIKDLIKLLIKEKSFKEFKKNKSYIVFIRQKFYNEKINVKGINGFYESYKKLMAINGFFKVYYKWFYDFKRKIPFIKEVTESDDYDFITNKTHKNKKFVGCYSKTNLSIRRVKQNHLITTFLFNKEITETEDKKFVGCYSKTNLSIRRVKKFKIIKVKTKDIPLLNLKLKKLFNERQNLFNKEKEI